MGTTFSQSPTSPEAQSIYLSSEIPGCYSCIERPLACMDVDINADLSLHLQVLLHVREQMHMFNVCILQLVTLVSCSRVSCQAELTSTAHFFLDGRDILVPDTAKYVCRAGQIHMGACRLAYSGLDTKARHFPADLFISYMTYLGSECTREQCYLAPLKLKIIAFPLFFTNQAMLSFL